jgi:DNA-binding response OmpR family regulator
MKILIVEDNQILSKYIKSSLENQGYSVDSSYNGFDAEKKILSTDYDLIVLDVMIPGKDGISLCNDLRKNGNKSKILMLTAKSDIEDKIKGLDSGVDDYITKPFDIRELLSRIRAIIRRGEEVNGDVYKIRDIEIDTISHRVFAKKKEILLTLKEYSLLEYLIINKGKVISRLDILEHCWDSDYEMNSNIVDVYIKRLRKKLNDKNEEYIKTVKGVGYRLEK